MKYKITYEDNPSCEDTNFLWQKITDIAISTQGHIKHESFGFFIRDEDGRLKGGCNGFIFYGCLHVDQLWVDDLLRGKEYGTDLMHSAENLAKQKNCLFITVNTMNWEALDFYKKLGFYIEFERNGFAKNSIFYFLRKNL